LLAFILARATSENVKVQIYPVTFVVRIVCQYA